MNWRTPVLFLCLAAAALLLLTRLPGGEEERAVSYVSMEPLTICVATDPHLLAPSLTDHGACFTRTITNADGKVMRYSGELAEAFFSQIAAERPDLLIISGDLTFNGERESHEAFAAHCAKLEAAGVPVLVLPGNHDLNCPQAARFTGDTCVRAESIDASAFRAIYAAFGYDEAVSEDPASLSYVVQPCPGLRVLLVDSNTAERDDAVPDESFSWIEAQLKAARDAGDRVVAVSHQTVLQHNSRFAEGFVIAGRERLLRLYQRYHVAVNLSGHMHIHHIKQASGLTEIVTGALSVQPCGYGVLRLDAAGGVYERRVTDVSAWAAANGRDEPELLDFAAYAEAFFQENTLRQQSALPPELAAFLADLNTAYFSGRMDLAPTDAAMLRALERTDAFTAAYVRSLAEDLGRDFTRLSFLFQE